MLAAEVGETTWQPPETYYLGGDKSGIPADIFAAPLRNEPIQGRHGLFLCTILPDKVSISRPDNSFHFDIYVAYGEAILNYRSRIDYPDGTWTHDPDLNAKLLFRKTMQHFAANGTEISKLRGKWVPGGDNYAVFVGGGCTRSAALRTWTGQRAAEHGYTKVLKPIYQPIEDPTDPDDNEVWLVTFVRPDYCANPFLSGGRATSRQGSKRQP